MSLSSHSVFLLQSVFPLAASLCLNPSLSASLQMNFAFSLPAFFPFFLCLCRLVAPSPQLLLTTSWAVCDNVITLDRKLISEPCICKLELDSDMKWQALRTDFRFLEMAFTHFLDPLHDVLCSCSTECHIMSDIIVNSAVLSRCDLMSLTHYLGKFSIWSTKLHFLYKFWNFARNWGTKTTISFNVIFSHQINQRTL